LKVCFVKNASSKLYALRQRFDTVLPHPLAPLLTRQLVALLQLENSCRDVRVLVYECRVVLLEYLLLCEQQGQCVSLKLSRKDSLDPHWPHLSGQT
jgi:hypothetical protein